MKDIDTYITNAHSDDFATEAEERANLNTFAAELANEDDCADGNDVSEYADERDEPWDGFRHDVEADADTLASAGYGTDEDYGYYGEESL
jgi:hypothetical protein